MKNFLYAVRPLIYDSLGVIVFAALVMLKVDFLLAAIAGAAIAAAIVLLDLVRDRPVPVLQWISLLLMLVSTAATYFTNDPRFVMGKPSIVYLIVGCVMLKRGWMNRYVPEESLPLIEDRMTLFGYIWAGLMFLTAILNLVIAVWFTARWPEFIAVFPLASKIALFLIHFASIRITARRRMVERDASSASHARA
ncbi:MAG TPA: septation protein IspZ [Rhizobiaceae bacterium]|nr:septation protein IspZ [Rhizobiaceae bacterium]